MRKMILGLSLILCLVRASVAANVLTGVGKNVLDASGNARATFSNSENITLWFQVNNTEDAGAISFEFYIDNPSGSPVLTHTGNTAPGTPGTSQTQISGIPISRFYSVPGKYTFRGKAIQGADSVTQTAEFVVASPNITLIYPPNGATGLSDTPMVFRWIGSGASRYRLTVSENAGLYPITHQNVNSGETSYTYPTNPTGPREQLVPDQVYYWKVEGLDAAGNTISQSTISNFSLQAMASSQSRNVIVTDLSMTSSLSGSGQPVNFKAVVYNAGSNAESNIGVKFSLGGLNAQDSPKQVQILSSGEQKDLTFTAFMPSDQEGSLAVACVDIFDDNLTDNCKTLMVSRNAGEATGSGEGGGEFTYDELWETLMKRLGPDALKALEGYTFDTIECPGCSASELNDLLSSLISGDASLSGASITDTGGLSAAAATQTGTVGETEAVSSPAAPEIDLDILKPVVSGQEEWTGYTTAFSGKDASTFVVSDKKAWKKLWQSLSESEVPEVNFDKKMVIGIVSAAKDRAETIRILSRRKTEEGLVVDYYYIQAVKGKQPSSAAYILKVIGRELEKVNFRRLDVEGGAR